MFFKFIIHNTDKNSSSFSFVFRHNREIEYRDIRRKGRWISVHSLQLIKIRGVHKKSSGRGNTPFPRPGAVPLQLFFSFIFFFRLKITLRTVQVLEEEDSCVVSP